MASRQEFADALGTPHRSERPDDAEASAGTMPRRRACRFGARGVQLPESARRRSLRPCGLQADPDFAAPGHGRTPRCAATRPVAIARRAKSAAGDDVLANLIHFRRACRPGPGASVCTRSSGGPCGRASLSRVSRRYGPAAGAAPRGDAATPRTRRAQTPYCLRLRYKVEASMPSVLAAASRVGARQHRLDVRALERFRG